MSTKEIQEKLVGRMKAWQVVEDASVKSTNEIMEKSQNPLIKLVMEIINRDSQLHKQVQAFVVDMYEKQAVSLTPEEMGDIWESIEKHVQLEKKMVGHVAETLEALKGRKMLVPEYLLNYLKQDEQKHDDMLSSLEKFKKGMYPYAS